LKGASDGVLCLAAELLYTRDAPLHDMKASTKADRIGAILASMSGAPSLPDAQRAGLDDGHSFAGGAAQADGGRGSQARQPRQGEVGLPVPFHRSETKGVPDDSPSIRYVVDADEHRPVEVQLDDGVWAEGFLEAYWHVEGVWSG
jgi:hypothetical protein